jgi:exodeoxyribonuclease V gamma subunit
MFYLHASNRTENLLQHMAALIEASPAGSLFEKEYILIQSQGMERMISQHMAMHFTSWCNYQFLLPVTFLESIAEKLDMEITPDSFERGVLCWRIEEKLRDIDEDVYRPLQQYLAGSQIELKRFQLARQIANIFDQYQLMRPEMLEAWRHNRTATGDAAELWQMHLWNRLLGDEVGGTSRGKLLRDIIEALHKPVTIPDLPARVSIFGVHILPPLFLEYLQGLSRHTEVHLFLLSPCRDYWGDVHRRRKPSTNEESAAHHPLLISLGQQGREFQELLLDKVQFANEFVSYEEPLDTANPRLLHKLQSDLLAGRAPISEKEVPADDSIRLISCHSRERELSVLRDHIIDLMEKNRELQLGDIVVMAPDIQEYAPFIPALFEDIQHSIADRSMSRRNICVSLFQQFLDLFTGRFGWSEVFDLLQKEQIYRQFQLCSPDLDKLRHWVNSAGIRWGLSSRTRQKKGFSFAENSWQSGLERLLMGVAIDSEDEVASVLPYTDIEGSEARSLGGLCEFIRLLENAENDFGKERSVHEWSEVLQKYGRMLIAERDSRDFVELSTMLQSLGDNGTFHHGMVTFEVITRWFEYTSTQTRSTSGFLKGSLTFCSMLPMRSIPFRAICLIGLNYGEFPESDRQLTYDLMKLRPKPGDRSMRADDRYQFLEVLLAARQWLYMSYIGQSLHNNNTLPPAVVVTELLEILESGYGVKDLAEHHPLHGFNRKYFSLDSMICSATVKGTFRSPRLWLLLKPTSQAMVARFCGNRD